MNDAQGDLSNSAVLSRMQDFLAHLGLEFSDISLLIRAFTHRSYFNEHPEILEDNERLEFLGDAVLDFLVASWLYHNFPELAEGNLTRLRSALVRNDQLAEFARSMGAGEAMLLGKGEHEGGGRKRNALLGSTFEAVVGALYLDKGIQAIQAFIEPLIKRAVTKILADEKYLDPKGLLQEWSQANGLGAPTYKTIEALGPDHAKVFIVEVLIAQKLSARGEGHSKQSAAKAAARLALENLGE